MVRRVTQAMMEHHDSLIASEGYPCIVVCFTLAAISGFPAWLLSSGLLCAIASFFALLTLFTLYFFRNPERTPPADERAVVAPADGAVVVVDRVPNTPLGCEALKISIFMSIFDVHVNRAPFSGRIVDMVHTPGAFFDARDRRSSFENERNGIVLKTASGVHLAVVQVAGLIARRIVCYPGLGDYLKRGERYGMIRFGSRLDVYLPLEIEPLVKRGDRTVAGETALARLDGY